ncbi:MAG: Hcp family type VI secretion system effector [Marinibacterium sp.]
MAQVDYFLKINGIDGESTDSKHPNEIDVLSWSWGETNSGTHGTGGGGGAGKVSMQDFNFVMTYNKASPLLMLKCAEGKHIPDAMLTCRRAGGNQQEYLIVTFTDLLISSYQTGGSAGDVVPVDQISFNYAKVEFEYKPQKKDGTLDAAVKTGYDLQANLKV